MNTRAVVTSLLAGEHVVHSTEAIQPVGPGVLHFATPPGLTVPANLNELNETISRTYDLSVTAAGKLNIPVIGDVSGGYSRRVIVLERSAYRSIEHSSTKYQYGYAIRLAITVSQVDSSIKLTLPFLAASAQVGRIEAKWTLQVVGLSGSEIDKVMLPPQELNVETFVTAKQSLSKLIDAVRHATTVFSAVQIAVELPEDIQRRRLLEAFGTTWAVYNISRGRSRGTANAEVDTAQPELRDAVSDTYKAYGLTDDEAKPTPHAKLDARLIVGDFKMEVK